MPKVTGKTEKAKSKAKKEKKKPKIEESRRQRSEAKFRGFCRINEKIASEAVAKHGQRANDPTNDLERLAMYPQEGVVHKPSSSRQCFNVTEKQKSIPEDALDEKGKRKRYRERRPQMPFDQEVQKAAAVPIGRKTANFDYNKNRKERREKQLNSTKSKKMCLDESNPGDFSIFGSPLSVKK